MILDARKLHNSKKLLCDICIVGSGAAGITLALELARTGKKIILLEAGEINKSGKSQKLYCGHTASSIRHLPLDIDRNRQLGGTTAVWGGRCISFDPIDFEDRPYVPFSGWPIRLNDILSYYKRAHQYCECGKFVYDTPVAFPEKTREIVDGFYDNDIVSSKIERWSPPTHFGKVYRKALKEAFNIDVYLNAICTRIVVSSDGNKVCSLEVQTFNQKKIFVKPNFTIISGGGLETTRLLLASNQTYKNGIGNHSDWLGRGYMCHINGIISRVQFKENTKVVFGYEIDKEGVYCRRKFTISEPAQRLHKILNINFLLDRPLLEDPSHKSAVMSLAFLLKNIGPQYIPNSDFNKKYNLYWRHFHNILSGSPELLTVLPKWCRKRFLEGRRIPSLLLENKPNLYYLYYHSEQVPDKSSRVKLSNDVDFFKVPRLFVDYRISNIDIDSIDRAHKLFDQRLRDFKVGFLKYESNDIKDLICNYQATLGHHIGTTRMASNPSNGVVDTNCRVHGINNLFIASSSVFPTCSQANPTLTIVAMAIRLADHLTKLLKR